MLHLHENKNFIDYSMAFSKGDFDRAEKELLTVISDSNSQLSYLYQRLADIYSEKKEFEAAQNSYIKAIQIDDNSLYAKLKYAKFLGFKIGNIKNAKNQINEILIFCIDNPFDETNGDYSSEYYISESKKILNQLENL